MKWFTNLFCRHEWEDTHVAQRWSFGSLRGLTYFQRCKKCGAHRRVDV